MFNSTLTLRGILTTAVQSPFSISLYAYGYQQCSLTKTLFVQPAKFSAATLEAELVQHIRVEGDAQNCSLCRFISSFLSKVQTTI